MTEYCVYLYTFDDLEMAKGAIASIPEGVPVHVFDGRHADFPGEYNLTPGLKAFCGLHPDCTYHEPPPEHRPFGSTADPAAYRTPGHAKASWVFDELPQSTWALKMDTDERLERVDVDFDALDSKHKYCPQIDFSGESRTVTIARLCKPKYWTPWIGDCWLPREVFPRETPIECLATAYTNDVYLATRFAYRSDLPAVRIRNIGSERPDDYQQRRMKQLRHRKRDDRFTELKTRVEGAGKS